MRLQNSITEADVAIAVTMPEILRLRADRLSEGIAILSPGRTPMTNRELVRQAEAICLDLRAAGITRSDRVALALPSGPEMASAFLAVASACGCAPLNSAGTADEFRYYLENLRAAAIILPPGDSPAREAAQDLGIKIIELVAEPQNAVGSFHLEFARASRAAAQDEAKLNDIALLLYTSGTTSRAKLVPLSHRNLIASARNVAAPLDLTAADRCLNFMPMYHGHSLLGCIWATIASGGELVCTKGFSAVNFFDWLNEFKPTWYSAVPTLHQAIVARAKQLGIEQFRSSLRLVRSASSSLPPPVMASIETLFGAPLLEAYGMTEAGHQIACNPRPPKVRKPGSVGLPMGMQVEIMSSSGELLPCGEIGEIVLKGDSVFSAYAENEAATAEAFHGGWFRTGDQGQFDSDGYLFITGRLKEIINRGGELVAPREIEEILLQHPAVAEAIAFAIPDKRVGEEIGAAVSLRPGNEVRENVLREFLSRRLSALKLPRKLLLVPTIPKTEVGKPDRIRAAERLGLLFAETAAKSRVERKQPRNEIEKLLLERWRRLLQLDEISIDDDFFDLGGDSLALVMMIADFEVTLGVRLDVIDLLEAATVAGLANLLQRGVNSGEKRRLFLIKPEGRREPLFLIGAGPRQQDLAYRLPPDLPVMGCLFHDFSKLPPSVRVEDIAAMHVRTIRAEQRIGPYFLGGWSGQGTIAYEVAQQLRAAGESVPLLVLFDSSFTRAATARAVLSEYVSKVWLHLKLISKMSPKALSAYLSEQLSWWRQRLAGWRKRLRLDLLRAMRSESGVPATVDAFIMIENEAISCYVPRPYDGDVLLFRCAERTRQSIQDMTDGWGSVVKGRLEIHDVAGNHRSIFLPPHVNKVGEILSRAVESAWHNTSIAAD